VGRYAFAIGGNAEAARLSGIPVTRVKVIVYLMTAVLTAFAALISAARTNGVTPGKHGLDSRAPRHHKRSSSAARACRGGRATMLGTLLRRAHLWTRSRTAMNTSLNVNSNWQLNPHRRNLARRSTLDSLAIRTEAQ